MPFSVHIYGKAFFSWTEDSSSSLLKSFNKLSDKNMVERLGIVKKYLVKSGYKKSSITFLK